MTSAVPFAIVLASDKVGFSEPRQARICVMLTWWRRRKERQQQVVRDADKLMALLGDGAYSEAVGRAVHDEESGGDPSSR